MYGLFHDTASNCDCVASNDTTINESCIGKDLEGSGLPNSRYYTCICVEVMSKSTEISDRKAGLRVKITGPSRYEAGMISTRQLSTVWLLEGASAVLTYKD
jgi:hypothetical protein